MRHQSIHPLVISVPIGFALLSGLGLSTGEQGTAQAQASRKQLSENNRQISAHAQRMIEDGRQIFRFDTFGSEAFWGDALQLHKASGVSKVCVSTIRLRNRLKAHAVAWVISRSLFVPFRAL